MNTKDSVVELPSGFAYLHNTAPSIRQHIRYYTEENFLGRKVDGYNKPYTALTIECIHAMQKAQTSANVMGFDLLVYDGYRPLRACQDFISWINTPKCDKEPLYYPNHDKADLFKLCYIDAISRHCSGSTVDVTLIRKDKMLKTDARWSYKTYLGHTVPYLDDGSVDMYSSFSLFDEASHYNSKWVPSAFLEKRNLLRHIMESAGFKACEHEWWCFTLKNEPFKQPFDFVY